MAESLRSEELSQYNDYILAGGNPKKWKWSSIDKAGTNDVGNVHNVLLAMAGGQREKGVGETRGTLEEFAKATGRRILYVGADNLLYDETGLLITQVDPADMVVPYANGKEN